MDQQNCKDTGEGLQGKAALNARAALAAMDPDIKASYHDLALEWRELPAQFDVLESGAA
jgi:hypothetical protein